MTTREVYIASAARTPIGKFQGSLSGVPAPELGATAIREAVARARIDPAAIDEVLMGQVVQAGTGQAPARQSAIKAGLPPSIGATTVNKVCASGLKAVVFAAQAIKAGDADVVVAGGMENMDLGPYLLPQGRFGYRLGNGEILDATVHDGLWCAIENWHMGSAAEFIAEQFIISREEMDRYALDSHRKAIAAIDTGKFKAEIVPVIVPQRKGPALVVDTDENPRRDTSMEALARLRPAFKPDGKVTAGNAPGITSGGAALVVVGGDVAEAHGLKPLVRITGYAQAAVEPKWIFDAPTHAIRRLLERTGLSLDDFELIEINEAFAAQVLANGKSLGWDWEKVNVNGGAIALGHPIGASGARILVTLIYALIDHGLERGLAALCLGGGESVAMSIERV
jgi:acetyl-CoA C-acetyltransferase